MPDEAIEKKEIKTSIGRLVVILLFIIGTVYTGVSGYNNILYEVRDLKKYIESNERDKNIQKSINEHLELENTELRERIKTIEDQRNFEQQMRSK